MQKNFPKLPSNEPLENMYAVEVLYWSSSMSALDIFFRQITTFIKVHVAFVFGLQTLWLIDFTKIYQLKGLKSKNEGQTNFYKHCDLTKRYIYFFYTLKWTTFFFESYFTLWCNGGLGVQLKKLKIILIRNFPMEQTMRI